MEQSSSTSSSKVPWAFLLSLCVICCVEFAIYRVTSRHWQTIYNHTHTAGENPIRFRAKIEIMRQSEPAIALVGSSQLREAIDAPYLTQLLAESGSPLVAYNLGMSKGTAVEHLMQVEQVISARPALIVLMTSWRSFFHNYEPDTLIHYLQDLPTLFTLIRYFGVYEFYKLTSDKIGRIAGNFLPSFHYYRTLRMDRVLPRIIEGEPLFHPDRAYTERKPEEYFRKRIEEYPETELYADSHATIKMEMFTDFVRRAERANIPVLIVDAPYHPYQSHVRPKSQPAWKAYKRFVDEHTKMKNVRYLSLEEIPHFEETEFIDFTHLGADGRKRFTDYLSERIQESLDGGGQKSPPLLDIDNGNSARPRSVSVR